MYDAWYRCTSAVAVLCCNTVHMCCAVILYCPILYVRSMAAPPPGGLQVVVHPLFTLRLRLTTTEDIQLSAGFSSHCRWDLRGGNAGKPLVRLHTSWYDEEDTGAFPNPTCLSCWRGQDSHCTPSVHRIAVNRWHILGTGPSGRATGNEDWLPASSCPSPAALFSFHE